MTYLFDTNTCIFAMRAHQKILRRMQETHPDDIGVSAVTLAELRFGAEMSARRGHNRAVQDRFLGPLAVLDFDATAAEAYAPLRVQLRAQPIGERDLLIAATALARGLVVITNNVREFSRVKGLRVEDWCQ